jgi:hypothetical protein
MADLHETQANRAAQEEIAAVVQRAYGLGGYRFYRQTDPWDLCIFGAHKFGREEVVAWLEIKDRSETLSIKRDMPPMLNFDKIVALQGIARITTAPVMIAMRFKGGEVCIHRVFADRTYPIVRSHYEVPRPGRPDSDILPLAVIDWRRWYFVHHRDKEYIRKQVAEQMGW